MNTGRTQFAQLMDLLPWCTVNRIGTPVGNLLAVTHSA
jgi:hypothetical protein